MFLLTPLVGEYSHKHRWVDLTQLYIIFMSGKSTWFQGIFIVEGVFDYSYTIPLLPTWLWHYIYNKLLFPLRAIQSFAHWHTLLHESFGFGRWDESSHHDESSWARFMLTSSWSNIIFATSWSEPPIFSVALLAFVFDYPSLASRINLRRY
jgi:hypothetical protein